MKKYLENNKLFIIYISILITLTTFGIILNFNNQNFAFIISNYVVIILIGIFIKKNNIFDYNITYRHNRIFVFWIILMISWIPCFLSYYPVLFEYDSEYQFYQIINNEYNAIQPLIHTMVCKLFFVIGKSINNVNFGFALYSIFQMGLLSYSISYSLNLMQKMSINKRIFIIILLWFMIFPMHAIISISMTKDIIFSALFLLVFCYLIEYYKFSKNNKIFFIKFIFIFSIMLLFKNNTMYAYLLLVIIILYSLIQKKYKENICIILTISISLIISLLLSNVLKKELNAYNDSKIEMLSVPIQQIALTYIEKFDTLDEQDISMINFIVSDEYIHEYKRYISDPIKKYVQYDKINLIKIQLLKTYIRLGIEHPVLYTKAFLYLNSGYWYLGDTTYMHIYDDISQRQGYLPTNMKEAMGVDVKKDSKLVFLEYLYELIATKNIHEKIPFISILFSPAFYIILFSTTIIFNKKKKKNFCYTLYWCYFLTILFGPCVLIRYSYPLIICTPLGIVCSLSNDQNYIKE